MTTAIEDETKAMDLGKLALAIVIEDLRARVSKAQLSEDEARELVAAALHRFPPDMHPELHALVDR